MPRLKTAGRLAREQLQIPGISESYRATLLKVIASDERRKTNERIAKLNPQAKRYAKKPKPVQPVEPTKTSNRDTSEAKTQRVFGPDGATKQKFTLDTFLDAIRNPEPLSVPVVDSVSVESVAPPVEPTAPAVEPAPAVIPIQVDKFQY